VREREGEKESVCVDVCEREREKLCVRGRGAAKESGLVESLRS